MRQLKRFLKKHGFYSRLALAFFTTVALANAMIVVITFLMLDILPIKIGLLTILVVDTVAAPVSAVLASLALNIRFNDR